MDDRNKLIQSH